MKAVKARVALIAGALAFVVTGVVMQLLRNSGASLPTHSYWEALILGAVAGGLLAAGWRVRRYVQGLRQAERERQNLVAGGESPEHARAAAGPIPVQAPDAEFARRTLVFAQAAAVGGAVLAGWELGQAAVQLDRWQTGTGRSAIIVLSVLAVVSIALSACGFRVQKWCEIPE